MESAGEEGAGRKVRGALYVHIKPDRSCATSPDSLFALNTYF